MEDFPSAYFFFVVVVTAVFRFARRSWRGGRRGVEVNEGGNRYFEKKKKEKKDEPNQQWREI